MREEVDRYIQGHWGGKRCELVTKIGRKWGQNNSRIAVDSAGALRVLVLGQENQSLRNILLPIKIAFRFTN